MTTAIHQEYEEGFDTLGTSGVVFYKFFSLFSAREDTVKFSRRIVDDDVDTDVVAEFRAYIKEQKEWVREKRQSPQEMKQRMWWIVEKIIENGIFSPGEQKHAMFWLDICLDQIV